MENTSKREREGYEGTDAEIHVEGRESVSVYERERSRHMYERDVCEILNIFEDLSVTFLKAIAT